MRNELRAIIDKWGNPSTLPDDFVFGILQGTETSKVEVSRIKQFTKTVNKHTKRIGINLGIEVKLTTYAARHTFATVLKRSGASPEFISENLGHKYLKITENYLSSFEFSMKETFQKKLLDFE